MEKELKAYLERITTEIEGVRAELGDVKDDVAGIKDNMAAKKDLQKSERKLVKKIGENTEYMKFMDDALASHRRNTEAHNAKLKKI